MIHMSLRNIMPAIEKYVGKLAKDIANLAGFKVAFDYQKDLVAKLSCNLTAVYKNTNTLSAKYAEAEKIDDIEKKAFFIRDTLLPLMAKLREVVDETETLMPKDYWPMPTYEELLFSEN